MRGRQQSKLQLPPESQRTARSRAWWQAFLILTLSLIIAGSVFGWRSTSAAGMVPENARAGELLFRSDADYERAVLLESSVDFRISGMVANVSVKQSFHNSGSDWREAVYVFPLPEQAAVRAMRMRIGERVIESEIREREAAQKVFQAAKAEGKKAGLIEQERPNLFTVSVANIGPGETITVELQYLQTVQYDAGEFSLRFPMTITPRYIPGERLTDENAEIAYVTTGNGWAYATDQVRDAARITPYQNPVPADENRIINPITISATIDAGLPLANIDSPWHDVRVTREEQLYRIEPAGGSVSMTRDFELRWRPDSGTVPQAAVFTETLADERYALLMLLPPAQTDDRQTLPRELIYVIDTSGSMGGVSIRQARASLQEALTRLRPGDRFNVIAFNDRPQALFDASQPASTERIEQARHHVAALEAGGGTEMRSALEQALGMRSDESYLRQVLFITDGAVGNENALFRLIHDRLGAARLFTVGIGSAPNSYFMRKAAEFGRGAFTYIGSGNEVSQRMTELFDKLDGPVAGDLAVRWPADVQAESYPSPLPDLYYGEALLLAARLDNFTGEVTVSGRTVDRQWQRRLTLDNDSNSRGIASVWAYRKITSLLDEKIAGRDEAAVRGDVIKVALAHHLVSPYTSFVAVDKTPGRQAGEMLNKETVLNARPAGQSAQPYAWPATAAGSDLNMIVGTVLLLTALIIWLLQSHVAWRARY